MQTDRSMMQFLQMLSKGPVVVALAAQNLSYYKSGLLDAEVSGVCPNTIYLDHAVVAVGYKIDTQNPDMSYVKYKNSWSQFWGEQGYFRYKLKNQEVTNGHCWSLYYSSEVNRPVV